MLQLVGEKHSLLLLWVCAGVGANHGTRCGEKQSRSWRHFWKHLTVYPLGQRNNTAGHRMGKMISTLNFGLIFVAETVAETVFFQVNTNTPDSVFHALAYLKELLISIHQNYVLPALTYIYHLLQRAWTNLQDSCKSVPKKCSFLKHYWVFLRTKILF